MLGLSVAWPPKVPTKRSAQPSPSTSPQPAPWPRMAVRVGKMPASLPTSLKLKGYSARAVERANDTATSVSGKRMEVLQSAGRSPAGPAWGAELRPFGFRNVNHRQRAAIPGRAAAAAGVPGDVELFALFIDGGAVGAAQG